MIIKSFPGVDHKSFVRETDVKPCQCSIIKVESFKIHRPRHMLVIVLTYYGETGFNESIADHESGKTFCFKGLSRK